MIHISRSPIHDFAVIYFFRGTTPAMKGGQYLFEESNELFGAENLASNLVEYTDEPDLETYLQSSGFENLKGLAVRSDTSRLTLVHVQISDNLKSPEIVFTYTKDGLSADTLKVAKLSLEQHFHLVVKEKIVRPEEMVFGQLDSSDIHQCILGISRELYSERIGLKSAEYRSTYSDRYTDAQLLFVRLTPLFSGTAGERES